MDIGFLAQMKHSVVFGAGGKSRLNSYHLEDGKVASGFQGPPTPSPSCGGSSVGEELRPRNLRFGGKKGNFEFRLLPMLWPHWART